MFFETQNLVIDKLTEADAICFHKICNQPFVLKWMEDWEHNLDEIRGLLVRILVRRSRQSGVA